MIRNLKALGLALVAVLAITAVSASAAQAAHRFTSESSVTFLKGEQKTENVFTTNGGTVRCTTARFESGELKGTELSSVTVHPTYSGCTAFGFIGATVNTEGCNYIIDAAGEGEMGTSTIECEAGHEIVVTAGTCTVKVPAQTPGTPTVDFTNEGSGATASILVTATVEKIKYTSSGGICGASGENGTYTGTVLTKGFKTSKFTEQTGIKFDTV
jgi:hypothetical protein